MTQEDLIKQLNYNFNKAKLKELIVAFYKNDFTLFNLIDLTFYNDKVIAFRAAWLLENCLLMNPLLQSAEIQYLLKRFNAVTYPSCQRHYAKIIMYLTSQKTDKAIINKIQLINMEPVVEQCFDWMIDPKVRIAVKVFAAEALFNLSHRYNWIAEELADQLKFLMNNGSPAIKSKGKKLLMRLKPSIN